VRALSDSTGGDQGERLKLGPKWRMTYTRLWTEEVREHCRGFRHREELRHGPFETEAEAAAGFRAEQDPMPEGFVDPRLLNSAGYNASPRRLRFAALCAYFSRVGAVMFAPLLQSNPATESDLANSRAVDVSAPGLVEGWARFVEDMVDQMRDAASGSEYDWSESYLSNCTFENVARIIVGRWVLCDFRQYGLNGLDEQRARVVHRRVAVRPNGF
jgi:hypothetical protein